MKRRSSILTLAVLVPLSIWLATCSVDLGLGPGGARVGVSLFGKTITLTLGDVGPMAFEAHVGIVVPTAFRLFESPPSEMPGRGRMILPSTSVAVGRRLEAKTAVQSQSLPLHGSATVRFRIAPGQSAELCDAAVMLAEYDLALTAGSAAIIDDAYDLSSEALSAMAANDVTICVEINADFDGELTVTDFQFVFEDEDGAIPGGDGTVAPLAGSLIRVPIGNRNGVAVRTGVNRIIGGVEYGIVGVLEATTPDVTVPTGNPASITISPAGLGLATVTRIYMALHSSFVPDVPDGVVLATLTATYSGGAAPTTLDFVLGENSAEWSYGRPEHATALGGVQHAMAPVLYSFTSSLDSTVEYTAYSYSESLALRSGQTLTGLTLAMAPPGTYISSRSDKVPEPTWAAQAITAVTLEGPALAPPPDPDPPEACCLAGGGCDDLDPGTCQYGGGTALGPDTSCAADASRCPESEPPEPEPTGACCLDDGTCLDESEFECVLDGGEYEGDNTICDATTCVPDTPAVEYVIWYTGNVCCWGAPLMYITDRTTFNQPRLRSSFPGGGINPTDPALKVELQGGFASVDDARAWICPQFTSSSFHYWCGRHYQFNGKNWQPGGLGCDFSSLPETTTPPTSDVCAEHAGDVPNDTIACCYPNTTCVEQSPADCSAGGGTPHPDGETRCGMSPCPDPCPEDGVCVEDCGDSILARDQDCERCDMEGTCILQCPDGDPDCCLGMNIVRNGDAESGAGATDFNSVVSTIPEWNVFQGNLTTVSYSASANSALNAADSAEISGGNNYFAGGPAGISPALAQNLIFLNEYTPLSAIRDGKVSATLSAYIGGWATHADDVIVSATFRDELTNDISGLSIGPVSNAERGNDSRLLYRCVSGPVPQNAVTVEVLITARRIIGSYNDGYVDNISLVLENDDCPSDDSEAGCD